MEYNQKDIFYYDGGTGPMIPLASKHISHLSGVGVSFLRKDDSFRKIVINVSPSNLKRTVSRYCADDEQVIVFPQAVYDKMLLNLRSEINLQSRGAQ